MRAQAMENLLIEFEEAVENLVEDRKRGNEVAIQYSVKQLMNLAHKSSILRDRSDRSANVIKKLVNK